MQMLQQLPCYPCLIVFQGNEVEKINSYDISHEVETKMAPDIHWNIPHIQNISIEYMASNCSGLDHNSERIKSGKQRQQG